MRHTHSPRVLSLGIPAALVGSLAVALTGPVAVAADRDSESHARELRILAPAAAHAAFAARASISALTPVAAVGPVAAVAAPTARTVPSTYVVRKGDTVSGIAARHALRTTDVLTWNRLSMTSVIYPGQVLKLRPAASAAAAAAKVTAPAKATAAVYVVRKGDTVSAIAARSALSIQALLTANRLSWSSIIYPGQKLTIPGRAAVAVKVPASTPAKKPVATAPAPVKTVAKVMTYTVRSGDTVSRIAGLHAVSVQAVLDANGLGWSSIIYPGQTLRLPSFTPAPTAAAPAGIPKAPGLDAEQARNAALIIAVGRELKVPERGIMIALGTAMQESWLRNLDWGDRDSLGLFQQRPSTGWGTAAQVRDAERSIRVFFGGPNDPNGIRTRGLLDIPGWESMSFAQAAQSVQISAYPDRYAQWEDDAKGWLAALG